MPRKAKKTKNTPFTLEMAEVFLGTIQADFISLREEMNSKFTAVYKRFDGVDKRLDKVEYRLNKVENTLNNIVKKDLWSHEHRILKLEKIVS